MRWISVRCLTAAALASALLAPRVPADETSRGSPGVFALGLGVVYLAPANPILSDGTSMGGKLYPQISGEWFLGRSWSTELALGTPTNFGVTNFGVKLGGIRLMPNAWTTMYRFAPESRLRPYLGAGFHYTRSSLIDQGPSNYTRIASSTVGAVAQAGLDVPASPNWHLKVDIRYLAWLEPSSGTVQGGLGAQPYRIDPFLYSLVGSYRW